MPLLALPDLRMESDFDCGETALRVVVAFHRVVVPAVRVSLPRDGIDPLGLERAFRRLHFQVTSGEMTVADLRHFCQDRPPVVLVHWPDAPDSHWVVVRGVSRGHVYYHDTDTGPGRLPLAEWDAAWGASDGRLPTGFRRWGICAWPG